MRFFSLILSFSLLISASHASNEGLARAFNELDYQLNVDHRATDPAHREAAQANFAADVHELQAQGLTNQELISFVVSRTPNRQAALEVEKVLTALDSRQMTTEMALELLAPVLGRPQGAAFTGELAGAVYGLVGSAIIIAIVVIATSGSEE